MKKIRKSNGTILLLALWALGLLTVLTINIGVQVRQQMELVSRLEHREELTLLARSGIERGLAVYYDAVQPDPEAEGKPLTPAQRRLGWMNNPGDFRDVDLGNGRVDLRYEEPDFVNGGMMTFYGFSDEERKININKTDVPTLARLAQEVLSVTEETAVDLARAVIDWRIYGESEIVGFLSDEYYDNLRSSYPEKKGDFENIQELQLLRGWTPDVCARMEPYLTVFGDGRINMNTAGRPVLLALGLRPEVVNTFLSVRRGPDGIAYTGDDVFFNGSGEMVAALEPFMKVSEEDAAWINKLSGQNALKADSGFYRIDSYARLPGAGEQKKISCVYSVQQRRFVSWGET